MTPGTGPQNDVDIDWYDGSRAELKWLFEEAEDSEIQLAAYLELGRVLVAKRHEEIVGHLQLVPTDESGTVELKSLAVAPPWQGRGVGRALVERASELSVAEGLTRMTLSTAAADVGNLRFYQRLGFRMLRVERDAFLPATGYPDPILIDGVALRDRVWFDRLLAEVPTA